MTAEQYMELHRITRDHVRMLNPNPSEEVLMAWRLEDEHARIYANWLKSKEAKAEPDDDFNIVINPIVQVKK